MVILSADRIFRSFGPGMISKRRDPKKKRRSLKVAVAVRAPAGADTGCMAGDPRLEGMGKRESEQVEKQGFLQAIDQLLDYAIVLGADLRLPLLVFLLRMARLEVDNVIDQRQTKSALVRESDWVHLTAAAGLAAQAHDEWSYPEKYEYRHL
jgi:hypothetical protein